MSITDELIVHVISKYTEVHVISKLLYSNTRYRHTLKTPKKCACIVIIPASDNRDTGIYVPVSRESQIFALRIRVFGVFFSGFLGFFFLGFFFGFLLGFFFGFFFWRMRRSSNNEPKRLFSMWNPSPGKGSFSMFQ